MQEWKIERKRKSREGGLWKTSAGVAVFPVSG